ncbi:MAG TPA: ABC transporter ATP-binding protein [Anaerolineaceae bacterium]
MLEVRDIQKSYEGKPLLRGISFRVADGETICLLGPSGGGKSTLLRIIAGLEPAEGGQVLWDGADMASIPTHLRGFGLMFQDYALFPHRSVAENVAFGLRMQHLPKAEITTRVQAALDQVNMAGFARRRVTDLSGGEQQRIALARALAPHPRLLMLDEPLGALDRTLREDLLLELRSVLHSAGIASIYVTHDQSEAFTIANRLVLLNHGSVAQEGKPEEIYRTPASAWVARFFGLGNLLEGVVTQPNPLSVQTAVGVFQAAALPGKTYAPGEPVTLLLRPTTARLTGISASPNTICGEVRDAFFHGEGYQARLRCSAGVEITIVAPEPILQGQQVCIHFPTQAVIPLRPG